uniref:Properdin n=1 Tax=Pogona vitticeps TaxID=103695 RepID=A0A6J0U262_9SAUR
MAVPWANLFPFLLVVFWCSGHLETLAEDVLCYEKFDDTTGTCSDLLGGGVRLEDCCLNRQYGFRQAVGGQCRACRAAKWSEWSPWSPCSVSCTEGVQRRSRMCQGVNEGDCVEGKREWEMRSCLLQDCCPVPGGWSAWSAWSHCSVTCLKGVQTRKRTCTSPAPVCGGTCEGNGEERQPCDTRQICPTHGNWGNWGNWESCPATCTLEGSGQKPQKRRRRLCNNPSPSTAPPGNHCQGSDLDHQECVGLPYCPQNGNWGSWKVTSPCSVTCGVGRVVEKRQCDNPAPKHGGMKCQGEDVRHRPCVTGQPCPVDGRWLAWSNWGKCEWLGLGTGIHCQEIPGLQSRRRRCVGKAHNGKSCDGKISESRTCYNIEFCSLPGSWSNWSPWSLCEPPCGPNPVKTRQRDCKPQYPNYPMMVEGENGVMQDVHFWGRPLPSCEKLQGQSLKVEERAPCLNVPPCEEG